MQLPRIKFIWGGAKQVPGHWHLGLWGTYEKAVGKRRKVAVSVRGLLLWLAGAAAAGYLVGATALYVWFERNDRNIVTYADTLLLPLRWDEVREKRGLMMIEEGMEDLAAKRWGEAHMKLRVGVSRAPRELRARRALAELYIASNQRAQAIKLLTDGLSEVYPGREYLTMLFTLAGQGEDFERIIAATERYEESAGNDRAWLLGQRLGALNAAGRQAEALQLAEQEGEGADSSAKEARTIALVELGRGEDALEFLEAWKQAIPGQRAQVVRLQVRVLRELGRRAEMNEALEEFRRLAPVDPRTYVYGVVQRWLAGDRDGADEALDDYFRRFSASPQNLMLMASAAAEAQALPIVKKCVARATAHGFKVGPMALVQLQTEIGAGEWASAFLTLDEARRHITKPDVLEEFALVWMERVLAVVRGDGSQAKLIEWLQQRTVPLRVYRVTAEVLVKAGRYEAAARVLDAGQRSFGASTRLARLREEVQRSLAAQAASETAPARVERQETSEREFFASLAELEAGENWSDAARLVREVRLAKPRWLSSREAEVLDAQMRIATHTGDQLEMLGAAKLYLDGTVGRALRVVAFARQLGENGRRAEGELLLKEVLRKNVDFPPALRLRQEWAPPPEAEKAK
jgi:hypothetical protein